MMMNDHKLLIYQVLPRLFGNVDGQNRPGGSICDNGSGKMSCFTSARLEELRRLGFTHIWFTGLLEHATTTSYPGILRDHPDVVKGLAGSPYAIKDYYDIDPDLADIPAERKEEFVRLLKRTHTAGLRMIMDFVPNHVARAYHSDCHPPLEEDFGYQDDRETRFRRDNNYYYLPGEMLVIGSDYGPEPSAYSEYPARATGNDVFHTHPSRDDWYDTVKLNYGVDPAGGQTHFGDSPVQDTWRKMYHILYYWAEQGVDGFRCDMAEMVPVPFWQWVLPKLRRRFPDLLFVGEIYQPWRYREYLDAGFDYLYDKAGLYDTLIGLLKGERSASDITHVWQSLEGLSGRLLHFMENHDEQRLASDFVVGDGAKALPAMAVSALMDGGPLMVYFGQMVGERGMDEEGFSGLNGRTSIYDYWSLSTMRALHRDGLSGPQKALLERYRRLLAIAGREVFHGGQFFDLMYAMGGQLDPGRQYAFLRHAEGELALVVANFADTEARLSLTLPEHAFRTLGVPEGAACRRSNLTAPEEGVQEFILDSRCPIALQVAPHDYSVILLKPAPDVHH